MESGWTTRTGLAGAAVDDAGPARGNSEDRDYESHAVPLPEARQCTVTPWGPMMGWDVRGEAHVGLAAMNLLGAV